MQDEGSKYKTIAVDQETHRLITLLAKSNDKTSLEYVADMAKYFSKYGQDVNSAPANVSKEMKLLNKSVIGFIRKQEELFLIPISSQMEEHKMQLSTIVKILENNIHTAKSNNTSNTDVTTISKVNLNFINESFQYIMKLNQRFKLIEPKEKYSYADMALITKSLKDKLENAGH